MTQTTNYHLLKPGYDDPVDVKDLNDNMDLIDVALTSKANLVGGKVPASELPSYVDDVIEGYYYNGAFYQDSAHTTAISGETGKIYIDLDSETCYRWTGSVYVKISSAADALYVEFTESSGVYSCDTGLADMYDALDEGREVIGVYDNNGAQEKYYVGNYSETGDYVTFYSYNSTGKIAELFGTGSGSETWSYDEFSLTGGGGGQLPTATNLGDIPSWNPGTQLWEITHKGTITSGSTGYATGGDVYTAIGNIPQIPTGTNTGDILEWSGSVWLAKPKWQMIYQPCEWIQSSGTQYIDTGVKISSLVRIVVEEALNHTASEFKVTGCADFENNGVISYGNIQQNVGKLSLMFVKKSSTPTEADWIKSTTQNDGTKHKIDMQNGSQKIDDIEVGTQTMASGYESANSIAIFARSSRTSGTTTINPYVSEKIYSYKIYSNNELTRDCIPVYNLFTGEAGLYDLVNNKFYGNSGTGTFTKGADV